MVDSLAAMVRKRSRPPRATAVAAALAVLAAGAGAAGCGGKRQDADEPSGTFRVRVTGASFPAHQAISQEAKMRIEVRNADRRTVPDVAVTVKTQPLSGPPPASPLAFAAPDTADTRLADNARPVWIVDRQPKAGQSAYTNTWALGSMYPGETSDFVWRLLPVKAGRYRVSWRVTPGLDGKARAASGERTRGSFDVTISDKPVPATVDDNGNVVRGARAGSGSVGQ
jgi:hypothetical protein